MKITLTRDRIISGIKDNLTDAIYHDNVTFLKTEKLDSDKYPRKFIDYVKEHFTDTLLWTGNNSTISNLFDIKALTNLIKESMLENLLSIPDRLFSDIFINKVNRLDWHNEPDEKDCIYVINDHYAFLDFPDLHTGSYSEFLFQMDKDGNIVLPDFDKIIMDIDNSWFKDTPQIRELLMKSLDKEEIIL